MSLSAIRKRVGTHHRQGGDVSVIRMQLPDQDRWYPLTGRWAD
jgi:hypothetical protein